MLILGNRLLIGQECVDLAYSSVKINYKFELSVINLKENIKY